MTWTEILQYIPPTNVALLVVIIWLFRCLEKKDALLKGLGDIVHKNSEVTTQLSTLITILVQGRRS